MKKINISAMLAGLLIGVSAQASKVDLAGSEIIWTGSKVIGSSHTGKVKMKSADIKYKKGLPVSAKIVVDMTTITNTDLKDPKWNKKLVTHLKSADFFNVDKFKTATLDVEKINKASDKHFMGIGKLTILNKTEPVKFHANLTEDKKDHQIYQVDLELDRTKWGIKYGSGSFFNDLGDKMISDDFKLTVKLKIKKDRSLASL